MQDDPNLSVPCPTCGSPVGQRCVLNTDQPRTTSHYDRRVIAKDFFAQSAKAARKMADDAKDSSDRRGFSGGPEVPSHTARAALVAELAELRSLQLTSLADATYVGWTREQLVAQQKRSDRISAVQRELNALDGTSGWSHSLWS